MNSQPFALVTGSAEYERTEYHIALRAEKPKDNEERINATPRVTAIGYWLLDNQQ